MRSAYSDCYQFDLLLATVKNKSEINPIINQSKRKFNNKIMKKRRKYIMRMDKEDLVTKENLEKLQANSKLEDEADVVLLGDPDAGYNVIKPEGGFEGVIKVDNPYKFAHENSSKKVLVKHSDGSFDRYNHGM